MWFQGYEPRRQDSHSRHAAAPGAPSPGTDEHPCCACWEPGRQSPADPLGRARQLVLTLCTPYTHPPTEAGADASSAWGTSPVPACP